MADQPNPPTYQEPPTRPRIEGPLAPMIGRTHELETLEQALGELVENRQGSFVLLTGEAGVGKSRLAAEFVQLCAAHPVTIFSGSSLAAPQAVTFWTFLELLRSSLDVTLDTPVEEVSQRLTNKTQQLLGARTGESLPYLQQLLSLAPADAPASRRIEFLDPSRLRQQIFLAVRAYLAAAAEQQPLILILEDMHWADEASVDLLLFILEMLPNSPVMIITISRPFLKGPLKRVRDWANTHLGERSHSIQLQHLAPTESHTLLEQYLGLQSLSARMRNRIVDRSAGIPFFMEEIVRMLVDAGVMQQVQGSWQITGTADLASFGVPNTMQSLILARFDRLHARERKVLQTAAVIGRQFNRQVLLHVLAPMEKKVLAQALGTLAKRDFISLPSEVSGDAYAFKHNIIVESIYASLEQPEQSLLHGQVGQALEAMYARQIDSQIDLLAQHYAMSDNKERALHYLLRAGQRAARSYLNHQAQDYYEEAIELLPGIAHEPAQAMHAYMGLGDVLLLVGEYQPARQHFEHALDLIAPEPTLKFQGEKCGLHRKIGATYERQGDYEQALGFLNKAKKMMEDTARPVPVEEAQVFNDTGWIYFRQGDFTQAERNLIHALSLAQQAGRLDVTASIYNRLGGVYWQKDDLDKATNFVQKSLALREEIGDTVAVARSYNNLGLLDWKRGKWESALQNFNRCLAMHANLGDVEGVIDVHGNLGLLQLDRGEVDDARAHLGESLRRAQQIGHTYITAMTLLYLSRLYVTTETWQTALDYANRSLKAFQEIGAKDELVDVYTNLGLTCLGLDDLAGASSWVEKAQALLPKGEDGQLLIRTDEGARTVRLLAEVSRRNKDYPQAEKQLNQCMELFTRLGNSLEQGRTTLAQARLAAEQGNQVGARVLLNEARLIFRQLDAKLDLSKLESLSSQLSGL